MEERSRTLPRKMPSNIVKIPNNSRPSSYYDNYRENGQPDISNKANELPPAVEMINMSADKGTEGSPTQEFLLMTTVPQNITGVNIAGKHTPTRNSLRHSRMIVMSRTGNVPVSYLPSVVKRYKLATALSVFQIIAGAAICCLAAWLLLWAPNLRKMDNPYWSGLPLLISGTFGLLLLCCCRRGRPGTPLGYLVNSTKICSIFFTMVASAASLIAGIFSLIHLITLSSMNCGPTQKISEPEGCICQIGVNSTSSTKTYHYKDLKCTQVNETLVSLLIFSCVVNLVAGIICLWYIYLHFSTKREYTYSKVRTKESRTIVSKT